MEKVSVMYDTLLGVVRYVMYYWPTQPGDPSTIRVASVIGISVSLSVLSVVCSLFSILYLFSVSYIFTNPTAVAHCINNGRI